MTRVVVSFEWQLVGSISLASGRPVFPIIDDVPGLYRFTFEWPDRPPGVYIGETDRLRRRAQHYRTPGPRQKTNLRMNKALTEALAAGTRVSFATMTTATIAQDDGTPTTLDLSRKTGRLIVENAAMAAVIAARDANPVGAPTLMNRPGVGEAEWR